MKATNRPSRAAAHVARIRSQVANRDSRGLLAELREAKTCKLDSEPAAYAARCELMPQIIRILFETLPFEEFVEAARENLINRWIVYDHVADFAETVPLERWLALAREIGLPSERHGEPVFRRLITDSSEETTIRIDAWIRESSNSEAKDGVSLSRHMKGMSAFQFVRWMPDDGHLSNAVTIMARRNDKLARKLTSEYLLTLPWGGDRRATASLLSALGEQKPPEYKTLIEQALVIHRQSPPVRRMLLKALSEYAPEDALLQAFADLKLAVADDERFEYLHWLSAAMAEANNHNSETDLSRIVDAITALDTRNWTVFSRGYLGMIVGQTFPDFPRSRICHWFDRTAIAVVILFECVRLEHMLWVFSLPIIVFLGFLFLTLLDVLIAKSNSLADDGALAFFWITAFFTSHTHFSGLETIAQKFRMAIALFSVFTVFILVAVICRL